MPLRLVLNVSFNWQPLIHFFGLHTVTESFCGVFRVSVFITHCHDFGAVEPALSFPIRGILQHLCCILNMHNSQIQKAREMKWNASCLTETSGNEFIDFLFLFFDSSAADDSKLDHLPSVPFVETICNEIVLCLCTFAYTLTSTLQMPAGKSLLDYYETVARVECGNKTTYTLQSFLFFF